MNKYMHNMSLPKETSFFYSHNNYTVQTVREKKDKGFLGFFHKLWRVIDLTGSEILGDFERIGRFFTLNKRQWTPPNQNIPAILSFSALHLTQKLHEAIFLLSKIAIRIENFTSRLIVHLGYLLFKPEKLKSFENSYPKNNPLNENRKVEVRERRSYLYQHLQSIKEKGSGHNYQDVISHAVIDYVSDQIEAIYGLANALICSLGLVFCILGCNCAKKCTLRNIVKNFEDMQVYQAKAMVDILKAVTEVPFRCLALLFCSKEAVKDALFRDSIYPLTPIVVDNE